MALRPLTDRRQSSVTALRPHRQASEQRDGPTASQTGVRAAGWPYGIQAIRSSSRMALRHPGHQIEQQDGPMGKQTPTPRASSFERAKRKKPRGSKPPNNREFEPLDFSAFLSSCGLRRCCVSALHKYPVKRFEPSHYAPHFPTSHF